MSQCVGVWVCTTVHLRKHAAVSVCVCLRVREAVWHDHGGRRNSYVCAHM